MNPNNPNFRTAEEWEALYIQLRAENDQLRAEVERLTLFHAKEVSRRQEAEAEVERLNGLLVRETNVSPWPEKIRLEFTENQYTDEIKRLKAQCENIKEILDNHGIGTLECLAQIREALAEYRASNDSLENRYQDQLQVTDKP